MYSDAGVVQTPVYSNGSWLAALPLANIADRRLSRVARSTDATAASTKGDIDLGVARDVGVLAILVPNLTKTAVPTIRWRGSTVSNFASTVYDSGTVAAWPTGVTAEDAAGLNVYTVTLPTTPQTARYWRFELVDTANVSGYLDVARVIVAGAYSPTINMIYGAKAGVETDTVRTLTDGGAAIYQEKPIRRTNVFSVENLAITEVYASIRKMQRLLGISRQLFFVFDPADPPTLMYERAYLCCMRELGALDYPNFAVNSAAFSLVEEL